MNSLLGKVEHYLAGDIYSDVFWDLFSFIYGLSAFICRPVLCVGFEHIFAPSGALGFPCSIPDRGMHFLVETLILLGFIHMSVSALVFEHSLKVITSLSCL